ncbi:MAG: ABC transporter ATP-binding protein [Gemmatimonadales bacterium]
MIRELVPLRPYLERYTGRYLAGFVAVIGSNLLNALQPIFLQAGIDGLSGADPRNAVTRAAALLLVAAAGAGALRYAMRRTLNGVSRVVERDLRNDLYAKLLRLPTAYFDRMPIGDLMARATNDLLSVRMVAGPAIMYLGDTLTRAVVLIPSMWILSPTLTLLALVPLLALPLLEARLGRLVHERSAAIQTHFGALTDYVHQNISGVRIVRAYSQETREMDGFARLNREYVRLNLSLARAQAALSPALALLGGLGGAVVLYVGGRLVLSDAISAGAFVAFFVYLALLVWPLIFLGWALNLSLRATAAMERLNRVFAEPESLASPTTPERLPECAGARSIDYVDVWFRHPGAPERRPAVAGVSFSVTAGSTVAIVGGTGAGKTSLVELLARLYDPDRGRILIDGVDIRRLSLTELRREIGFVPQETFLFSDTLRGNVLLGTEQSARLDEAVAASRLSDALPDLPKGLDTMLGERGVNLSGGQRQRTAIARALVRDPAIVVLDDALSAVDAETEARILEELRNSLSGRTVLVVSHRAAAVRDADLILVMDRGEVVERGSYDELLARNGRFAELIRRQLLEEELESATATDAESPESASGARRPDG